MRMVSNRNRFISESTTDDEGHDDMDYMPPSNQQATNKPPRKPTRTPKCFSKNALMARENRLKKKMYITSLEQQVSELKHNNKKLSCTVESQARKIEELTKESKYLKSVLANNEALGKLIKAINSSTGLPVGSSLDKKLATPATTASSKMAIHEDTLDQSSGKCSWETLDSSASYASIPTPESSSSYYESPDFEELNSDGLLLDMDLPLEMDNNELLDMIDEKVLDAPMLIPTQEPKVKQENSIKVEQDPDVGVCLHVSKNKVSLEFCPSCSDNAYKGWS